jgi:hypothetical protein
MASFASPACGGSHFFNLKSVEVLLLERSAFAVPDYGATGKSYDKIILMTKSFLKGKREEKICKCAYDSTCLCDVRPQTGDHQPSQFLSTARQRWSPLQYPVRDVAH